MYADGPQYLTYEFMKMTKRLLIALMLGVMATLGLYAAGPAWEHVQTPPAEIVEVISPDSSAEIVVRDGYIYLYLSRPTEVKLFSILGQPISTVQLSAGFHRIRMSARGIYLLRAGNTTRRVTL